MNYPKKTSSLKYSAQASLRFSLVAEVALEYLDVPVNSAISECNLLQSRANSNDKTGDTVRRAHEGPLIFVSETYLAVLGANLEYMKYFI